MKHEESSGTNESRRKKDNPMMMMTFTLKMKSVALQLCQEEDENLLLHFMLAEIYVFSSINICVSPSAQTGVANLASATGNIVKGEW